MRSKHARRRCVVDTTKSYTRGRKRCQQCRDYHLSLFFPPSLIRRVIPRYMKRMTIVALLSNEEIVLRRSTHSR